MDTDQKPVAARFSYKGEYFYGALANPMEGPGIDLHEFFPYTKEVGIGSSVRVTGYCLETVHGPMAERILIAFEKYLKTRKPRPKPVVARLKNDRVFASA